LQHNIWQNDIWQNDTWQNDPLQNDTQWNDSQRFTLALLTNVTRDKRSSLLLKVVNVEQKRLMACCPVGTEEGIHYFIMAGKCRNFWPKDIYPKQMLPHVVLVASRHNLSNRYLIIIVAIVSYIRHFIVN
jgi:hypothetical protein